MNPSEPVPGDDRDSPLRERKRVRLSGAAAILALTLLTAGLLILLCPFGLDFLTWALEHAFTF